MKAAGITRNTYIQPLTDIYLYSNTGNEIAPIGNISYLYILGSIAAIVLLIACINFMNLTTARSEKRAKEVGVRKVMGAMKASLIRQFLGESILLSIVALAAALLLTQIALPLFNTLTQKDLTLFSQPQLAGWALALTLFTGILSGLYPAFYLSSFRPVLVLKGKVLTAFSALAIRKTLVVFQFTISICLIVGAIVIIQQLDFLKKQYLGFKKDQQIILPLKSAEGSGHYTALKSELQKQPFIKSVTAGSSYPGLSGIICDMLFTAEGKPASENVDVSLAVVEDDYLQTLGMQLLQGRPVASSSAADSNSIVLNEAALQQLGYDPGNAIGKKIYYEVMQHSLREMRIVGVVRDFHYESLHRQIKPHGFITAPFANKYAYMVLNVSAGDYARQLAAIEKDWKKVNPNSPFLYSFLDQEFQRNYEKDRRTSGIVLSFTFITIFVACLGLFGLAAFTAERRIREIGIRKVLGASVTSITSLLSKDFIRLVAISIVIGSPIAWYAMDRWLENFAYRITISGWIFALAGSLAILVALLTVSFQAIRAAIANPIKSLRTE
jgi:putative ABC transport system permease protein